jgi:hypothetical protein
MHNVYSKAYGIVLVIFFLLSSAAPLIAFMDENPDARLEDFFDNPSFEEDLFINEFLDSIPLDAQMGVRAISPSDLFTLLDALNIDPSLETDFYKRTNPFVVRSLLDLPIFEIHRCNNPGDWILGGQLFWNHTNRSVFNCESTNINSYLNLNFETLIDIMRMAIDQPQFSDQSIAQELSSILSTTDFDTIFNIISSFTVEQRRTGIMFQAWRQWHRGELRLMLPLYYLERNIFTTPENQSALQQQFSQVGLTPNEESQNRFEKNHAISDKVGLGDLRIEADYYAYKTETTAIGLGVMATLPTWVDFAEGLRGTSFDKPRKCDLSMTTTLVVQQVPCTTLPQPVLDLQADLLDFITINGNTPSISDIDTVQSLLLGDLCRNTGFLLGALDRLNAILLETPLGNYRHVGIGPLIRIETSLAALLDEYEWASRITFNYRLSAEFFTPAQETRFFVHRNSPAEFAAHDFTNTDPIVAQANLVFLSQELVNQLYPYGFKVRVQPGPLLRSTSRWCFSGKVWDINLGSDMWFQLKEKIGSPPIDPEILPLDINGAKTGTAYQGKLYGGVGMKVDRPTHRWHFGLNFEFTVWQKWIGKDYTASLSAEVNF